MGCPRLDSVKFIRLAGVKKYMKSLKNNCKHVKSVRLVQVFQNSVYPVVPKLSKKCLN